MKKLNKLFAILFTVLGMTTLKAQTDVTDQYLTNAGFDDETSFVNNGVCTYAKDCSANGTTLSQMQPVNGWTFGVANGDARASGAYAWGAKHFLGGKGYTIPSTDEEGNIAGGALGICAVWDAVLYYYQEVTLKPGVYEFSYCVYNSGNGANAVNKNLFGFVADNGTSYYGATKTFTSNSWTKETISFTLATETKGKISVGIDAANAGSGNSHHLFVDYIKLIRKSFDEVNAENPVDLTSLANNTVAGWTFNSSNRDHKITNYNGQNMVQCYADNYYTGDAMTQTISGLPVGKYEVEVYCQAQLANWNNHPLVADDGATDITYLSANDVKQGIPVYHDKNARTKTLYTLSDIKVTDGALTIKITNEKQGANWILAHINKITYFGPDKTLYEEAFNTKYGTLSSLNTADYPATFATKITNLVNAYNKSSASMTLSELEAANAAMDAVLNVHESIKAEYANLEKLISTCTGYVEEDYSSVEDESTRTAFNEAITTASTNGNKATTVEELTEAFNALEAARQTFVKIAIPTTGKSYDMTFMIENPSFETGDLTGWTVTASSDTGVKPNSDGTYATAGVDGSYLFNTYWKGNPLTQEISGLPSGVYELKVLVASDGATVYLTADDAHNEGTMTSDKTIFLESSIKFVCTDGSAVIGVVGGADGDAAVHKDFIADGYWWYKADNFRLYRSFDPSTAQNEVKNLKNSATALLSKPMNKDVKANFESKINNADETSDNPFKLASMATMLNEAIAEAKVSITEYEKLKKYIDMTAVFVDDVTAYTNKYNNGEYTSADVEPTRQELNVMRFNAASAIYTNKVDVTGWTGSMGERNDQHWSGNTVSYKDANSWGDTNDDALTTTVHLVKGNYVLKVAGRSHANALLTLEVLGETIEFHAKGDTGYGIDTEGKANFSADAKYANDGAGRGWEWEFLKFTLDTEQDVVLSVNSYYNNNWQVWNSFGDITLWMDDETYMTVNGHTIDEPLAAAKALVDTRPMGDQENTALQNAINGCDTKATTPDELNAQIDALETAVANAKKWIEDYNKDKALLVDALERFQANYNNTDETYGGMSKDCWNTLLNAVKDAALEKDNVISYETFSEKATALENAMNVADQSILIGNKLVSFTNSIEQYNSGVQNKDLSTAIEYARNESNWDNDEAIKNAIVALDDAFAEYKENNLTGNISVGAILGGNLNFEETQSSQNSRFTNVWDIPGWINNFNSTAIDANIGYIFKTQVADVPSEIGSTNSLRMRAKWQDTKATVQVRKEATLPSGRYTVSFHIKAPNTSWNENLNYYEVNGERKTISASKDWEKKEIVFEITEPTKFVLSFGFVGGQGDKDAEVFVDDADLMLHFDIEAVRNELADAIEEAKKVRDNTCPVGEEAFQVSTESEAYKNLNDAIGEAEELCENGTYANIVKAIALLPNLAETYQNNYVLNAPKENTRYTFTFNCEGHIANGNAITLIENGRKDQGLYGIKYLTVANKNYAQAFELTKATGRNCYYFSQTSSTDGTIYLTTATLGYNATNYHAGIRLTTEKDKALEVQIIPTDGGYTLYNTMAETTITHNGNNNNDVFTKKNNNVTFTIAEAQMAEVTLKISSAGWATLILPFNAALPDDVKAYASDVVEGDVVKLKEAESLVANTPYLIKSTIEIQADEKREFNFSGYGLADKDSYTVDLFVGTYVDYKTTANSNTYVLQNQKGNVAFYLVGESKQPTVGAYRSYMKYEAPAGETSAPMFRIGGTTGIDNATLPSSDEVVIYDLMGRKVTTMEKGNMYIINGRKVIVK